MKRGPTGQYETSITDGEAVRAFLPAPLPPDPMLDLSGGRQRLLERALLACGRLDGVTALLPDPNLLLYIYVRREAVLSNYVAALEHGMARLYGGFPLSNRLLREVHGKLLASGRGADKQPGEFRSSQNWLSGTRPGNAHFVPPPPQHVQNCMSSLERFVHAEGDGLPTLVRSAVAHVQFETIHPFLDGDGRVGRLLISLMLHDDGILGQPLLYLSHYFKQHRAEYYRLLDAARADGDWEAWLDFFLEGVEITAGAAVDTAHRLLELFSQDAARVQALGRAAANALRVFDAFRDRPLATIPALTGQTGASYPTVARAVEALENLGGVREITGRKRERIFAYEGHLDILAEGTEPL